MREADTKPMTELSYVIIGKNAQSSIARLLDSVLANTPSCLSAEIIYVDSASTDRTIEIVSQYPVTIIQLSADQLLCASAGRYVGSEYATGSLICFLDSDMELLDGWLERALIELEANPQVAVVAGVVLDSDSALPSECVPPVDYSLYSNPKVKDVRFVGGAALCRRSILTGVGGWNPFLISDEEPELCLRIRNAGYRVIRLEYPMVRHHTLPLSRLTSLLARRGRRLYVGQGQTIRYYLMSRQPLRAYLADRGFALAGVGVMLLAFASVLLSWVTMNGYWFLCFLFVLGSVIVIDAVRTHSIYKPLFHMLHRAVILEGTIKGFMMPPHHPNEYPGKITFIRRADALPSRINAVASSREAEGKPVSVVNSQHDSVRLAYDLKPSL